MKLDTSLIKEREVLDIIRKDGALIAYAVLSRHMECDGSRHKFCEGVNVAEERTSNNLTLDERRALGVEDGFFVYLSQREATVRANCWNFFIPVLCYEEDFVTAGSILNYDERRELDWFEAAIFHKVTLTKTHYDRAKILAAEQVKDFAREMGIDDVS